MLTQNFIIPKYNWIVDVYYHVTCYHIEEIINKLKEVEANKTSIKDAYDNMKHCKLNTGITYTNLRNKHTIVVISDTSCPAQFLNSYCHEIKHLERHIEEYYDIDPYSEEAAYLTGTIHQLMFPTAKYFLCDCNK